MSKSHILITGAGGFIGGYYVMTMLGKLVLNQPLYRYSIKDYRPGGLQTTSERRPSAR